MHRGLHPQSSVGKLYIPRVQGDRQRLSVKDCVEPERSNLFDYAANNNKRLLKAEKLQLRTKIDRKNKEEQKNERQTT